MTVRELIKELSKYPQDMKVSSINTVFENRLGELILTHEDTPQEIAEKRAIKEDWYKQHQERMDSRGEITSFANRW